MTHIKKIYSPLAFGAAYLYLSLAKAYAQGTQGFGGPSPNLSGLATGDSESSVRSAITGVVNVVLKFLALIAVIFVIVGGFRILAAGGNEENVTKGRKTIIYALIGLLIIFFAQVIVGFFTGVIGGGEGTS